MEILNNILYVLIIAFTVIMPIIPTSFQISNITFNGDTILFMIILYFLLILILRGNNIFKYYRSFFKDNINIFMVIWVITMFISVIYSKDKFLAFTESVRLSSYVFLFFILKYYINEERIYGCIIKSYMLSSFIISVYGIYEKFMGIGILKSSKFGTEIRISSLLENPNNLGMYFVFAIFPFIILSIKEKELKRRIVYIVLSVLALFSIINSYSRNALVGFAVGTILVVIILGIKYIFLTAIPVVMLFFMPTLSNRVKDISDMSQNMSRIEIWKIAFTIINDHPFLGIGNGNYARFCNEYSNKKETIIHPHNAFLKALSELGIMGLISFVGIIITSFISVYKLIKDKKQNFYNCFYTGIFISLFSMVCMNLIDSFLSAPKVIVYYFITIGICEGIRRNYEKSL